MPPVSRPLPRFIADSSVEGLPYGRWAQQLREAFAKACEPHVAESGGPPGEITWFPERGWGGRVYVPAIAAGRGRGQDRASTSATSRSSGTRTAPRRT